MTKLSKLDEQILTLQGKQIGDLIGQKTLTHRRALISICEMHNPVPGSGEAIRAFDLGIRFLKAKDSLELEDKELDFIRQVVEKSPIFVSVVIGRLIHYLDEAKTEKVESK